MSLNNKLATLPANKGAEGGDTKKFVHRVKEKKNLGKVVLIKI